MADFEDIRYKELDELTDEDKQVIRDNVDNLTDEEREAFRDFTTPDEEDKGVGSEDTEDTTEKTEEFRFQTQADFDAAVEKKFQEEMKKQEEARKAEEKKPDPEDDKFFPDDYKAENWNDAAERMYGKFKDRLTKEQQQQAAEQAKRIEEINRQFDAEIDELAKEDKDIPPAGTPERQEYARKLTEIGIEYKGVQNMTQAHKIYKALEGAGKPTVSEKQKSVASKVGRGGGEGTTAKPRKYSELSERSLDEMLEEDARILGVKD